MALGQGQIHLGAGAVPWGVFANDTERILRYVVEQFGDYRADYENLRKDELLKQAIKSNPMLAYKEEVIEIGADGSPIDEEEWFD